MVEVWGLGFEGSGSGSGCRDQSGGLGVGPGSFLAEGAPQWDPSLGPGGSCHGNV